MTTPEERTMAVFKVQAFLSRLMTPLDGGYKGIPAAHAEALPDGL